MRLKATLISVLLLSAIFAAPARAGARTDHWSGADLGVGVPFPSVFGVLVGFNIQDDARISAGAGTAINWDVYQIDSKFFLSPDALAFYIGGGLDFLRGKRGDFLLWNFNFDNLFMPYLQTGFDYQTDLGIHFTVNLAVAVPKGSLVVLPGLAVGWYF